VTSDFDCVLLFLLSDALLLCLFLGVSLFTYPSCSLDFLGYRTTLAFSAKVSLGETVSRIPICIIPPIITLVGFTERTAALGAAARCND
jgi:hypothetical protein